MWCYQLVPSWPGWGPHLPPRPCERGSRGSASSRVVPRTISACPGRHDGLAALRPALGLVSWSTACSGPGGGSGNTSPASQAPGGQFSYLLPVLGPASGKMTQHRPCPNPRWSGAFREKQDCPPVAPQLPRAAPSVPRNNRCPDRPGLSARAQPTLARQCHGCWAHCAV